MDRKNTAVTAFLDGLDHPLRPEIEALRSIILGSVEGLAENIKWNGPNYSFEQQDRITMKIQPPKQIQLIFHRGAQKLAQPEDRLIDTRSELLSWKENDRAVLSFKKGNEINNAEAELREIVTKWVDAARGA